MTDLFEELRRRNVIRVGIFYVISAWLVLQIADLIFEVLLVPDWTLRFMFGALVAAFPFALFLAWAYEVTPEGVKRESEVDRSTSVTGETGRKLDRVIAGLLVVLIAIVAFDRFRADPVADVSAETSRADSGASVDAAGTKTDSPSRATADSEQSPAPGDDRRSIAVLPFVNMSTDEENEVFSDGISEEILNVLAKIPALKVAARTSAFQFKGQSLGIAEIGEALNVDHVLEGSVRRAGDRIRVTAQLIQTADGFHLWSESFDRDLIDIFAIQDEIAGAIATALKTTLELDLPDNRSNLTGTTSLEAYELYLEGMQQWHLREAESLQRATSLFEAAIKIDPGFAKAHAGLALTLNVIPSYLGEDATPYLADAEAAARRAIELDANNAEAYAALGGIAGPDTDGSYYERAIKLKPSFATAYQWQGQRAGSFGDTERAIELLNRAFELDPRSRIIGTSLAWAYSANERYEEGLAVLADVESWAPGYNETRESSTMLRILMDDPAGARRELEALALALGKDVATAELYMELFDNEDSGRALETILAWPPTSRRDPSSPVLLYNFNLVLVLAKAGLVEDAEQLFRDVANRNPAAIAFSLGLRSLTAFYCRPGVRAVILELGYPIDCEDSPP